MPAREEFISWLREALIHLYDTQYLRQSPLLEILGTQGAVEPASALRERLLKAVADLKPAPTVPTSSRDWRLYDALFHPYVQQLNQRLVADQLALSVRQLRREQRTALEILADRLWKPASDVPSAQHKPVLINNDNGSTFHREFDWLKDLPPAQPTDLAAALAETLTLIQPLATQNHTRIVTTGWEELPYLSVHPVALNQILLNVLTVAIARAVEGVVTVAARVLSWDIEIIVQPPGGGASTALLTADEAASIAIAEHLAHLCNGTLARSNVGADEGSFAVRVTLPLLNQVAVLAIDDNADTLQLLERYTVGTRYRFVGTSTPEEAFALAEAHQPHLIILDVMMPQIDGLKMIGMLRQHPCTQSVPIIVCTILPQEKLVLSLGADGFLRKPFTRQTLLDTLTQHLAARRPGTESH